MTIVGIPAKDSLEAMQEFVAKYGLEDVPQVADVEDSIWGMYGVRYQPAWVFINQDGTTETYAGELAGPALDTAIEDLLDR